MKQTVFTTGTTVKYYTSIRTSDGRSISIRMEPRIYIDSVGESTFATADPQVIEALKNHPYFGKTFRIKSEPEATAADTGATNSNTELIKVAGITNKQMALEWLRENKQLELKSTMNVEQVKAAAADAGVEFSDWG